MADTDTDKTLPVLTKADQDAWYWVGRFTLHGLTVSQAEVLAWRHGLDRHAVDEALIAARKKGVDASFVFDAFS